MILSSHTARKLRNASLSALYRVAYDHDVDLSDVMASLTPSQPIPQAPAARTSPVPVAVQAEEERHASSVNNSDAFDPPPMDGTTHHRGAGASPTPSPLPGDPADGAGIPPNRIPAPSAAFSPKRVTNRQLVRDAHAAHPDWTASQIASDTGLGTQQVRVIASQCSLSLPSDARPENPNLRDRVIAAYEANPIATNREIAQAVGCSYATVSAWLSGMREAKPQELAEQAEPPAPHNDLETPPASIPAKPKRVTLADKIRAHLADHPDATARDVVNAVGGSLTSIGWAAQRAGITLRKYTAEERSEATARGQRARARIAPAQTTPTVEPFDDDEPAPLVRRVMKAPTGRFYLRDGERFVHMSLLPSPTGPGPLMTFVRKDAWFDTMDRYRGAKKLWPELADMRKEGAAS